MKILLEKVTLILKGLISFYILANLIKFLLEYVWKEVVQLHQFKSMVELLCDHLWWASVAAYFSKYCSMHLWR